MPYQGKKQQQAPEEHKIARPEEQFVPEQRTFGMPNSLMQAVPITPPSGTPNSVMREMDADDSGFSFNRRGYDPVLGVHELSHTVRRKSVTGPVSLSVPSGTIQREPTPEGPEDSDKESVKRKLGEESNRAGLLKGQFDSIAHTIPFYIAQLNGQIANEEDPEVAGRMSDFVDRVSKASERLANMQAYLAEARMNLESSTSDTVDPQTMTQLTYATPKLNEYVALFNQLRRLRENPTDIADHEHEIKDLIAEFEDEGSPAPAAPEPKKGLIRRGLDKLGKLFGRKNKEEDK